MNHVQSLIIAWLFLSTLLPNSVAIGQDVLVINNKKGTTTRRTGTITDWQGDKITLDNGTRSRSFPRSSVVELKTVWPKSLSAARDAVAQQDFEAAVSHYRTAKRAEPRQWVKTIINSELIEVFDLLESPAAAVPHFLEIVQHDSKTRFFGHIPLSWSIDEIKQPSQQQSSQWLRIDRPLGKLIGASWQLPYNREMATEELERLSRNSDKRIAQLATAQLWRTNLSPTASDVQRWARQIEKIEVELRAGPLTLLAATQKRLGMTEQAKINFLKIPILYPQKKSLSAFALYHCGQIMADQNQTENSASLWRELIRDFPSNQHAKFAKGKL